MGATPHYLGRRDIGQPFPAKYAGRCNGCEEPFQPNAFVQYKDGELYLDHECSTPSDGPVYVTERRSDGRTPINVMPHGKTARDACPSCFVIHSSNQTECY